MSSIGALTIVSQAIAGPSCVAPERSGGERQAEVTRVDQRHRTRSARRAAGRGRRSDARADDVGQPGHDRQLGVADDEAEPTPLVTCSDAIVKKAMNGSSTYSSTSSTRR
jgi:hypothetical protein